MLRLHPAIIDYVIIGIYFVVVLGIGFIARLAIKTDLDFFLSGRSLPAWITGLAFIAANLGRARDPSPGGQRRPVRRCRRPLLLVGRSTRRTGRLIGTGQETAA